MEKDALDALITTAPLQFLAPLQQGVNFALSQDVTGLCTSADVTILPMFLDACEQFEPMDAVQQEGLIAVAGDYKTIFDQVSPNLNFWKLS